MARRTKALRAILREITHSADRSSLFWWMVENHDELAAAASRRRLQWARLCARFAELELTDVTGKPANEETARSTWRRARREVTEARARLAAQPPPRPGAKYPSRISPNWRPQEVIPAPPPPLPAPSANALAAVGALAGDGKKFSPEVEANWAHAWDFLKTLDKQRGF